MIIFHLKSALPALNRSLWRWKNNHQFRFGRVPCLPCHPVLLPGWGQCPSWPQQEPGILCRRPRREHPPDCRGGQALCRRWPDLHHQLHFPVHKGKGFDPEREARRPALSLPSSLPLLPAIPLWCSVRLSREGLAFTFLALPPLLTCPQPSICYWLLKRVASLPEASECPSGQEAFTGDSHQRHVVRVERVEQDLHGLLFQLSERMFTGPNRAAEFKAPAFVDLVGQPWSGCPCFGLKLEVKSGSPAKRELCSIASAGSSSVCLPECYLWAF